MAPNVKLPADFGIRHLGKPVHGNLVLKLKDDVQVRVNSVIMSLNSPLIDRITTDHNESSIEVLGFSKTAVDIFVEAMYSGEVEKMDKLNFREINEMAYVFHVLWLKKYCWKFYKIVCSSALIHNKDYNHSGLLYAVEEAIYVSQTQNNRHFIDHLTDRLSTMVNYKKLFLERYIMGLKNMNESQMDFVVSVTGLHVDIIVTGLKKYFSKNGNSIDNNTRYLLKAFLFSTHNREQAIKLLDLLAEVDYGTSQDYHTAIGLCKQVVNTSNKPVQMSTKILTFVKPSVTSIFKYLNCNEIFEYFTNYIGGLNQYMLVEGVLMWLSKHPEHNKWEYFLMVAFIDKIIKLLKIRDLKPVSKFFLKKCPSNISPEFMNMMKISPLVTKVYFKGEYVFESEESITAHQLFFAYNKLHFYFDHPKTNNCEKVGDCGFILYTTPSSKDNPDGFDIKLSINPKDYSEEIHFHEELITASRMHITLVYNSNSDSEQQLYVSWTEKPHFCEDEKHSSRPYFYREYWKWGKYKFTQLFKSSPSSSKRRIPGENWFSLGYGKLSIRIYYSS